MVATLEDFVLLCSIACFIVVIYPFMQVRNIYIVLADGMPPPDWLNLNADQIKIVRHSEILPQSALPTFNSHAIESALHKIGGLAENFIYLNDDMYVYQPVSKATFFKDNGMPIVWAGWSGRFDSRMSHDMAVSNSLRGLRSHNFLRRWPDWTDMHHQAKALTKSAMQRVDTEYSSEISVTQHSPFRSVDDVWAILMATVICVDEDRCTRQVSPPRSSFQMLTSTNSPDRVFRSIRDERPVLACVNDSTSSNAVALQSELENTFPGKSRFEF
jgi:hypothetical protein